MKTLEFKTLLFCTVLFFAFVFYESCGPDFGDAQPKKDPLCKIVDPENESAIHVGTTVPIVVQITKNDYILENITIYVTDNNQFFGAGDKRVATIQAVKNQDEYRWDWNTGEMPPGTFFIQVKASFNNSKTAKTAIEVELTTTAPIVATADVSGITASSAMAGGNVTDDGGLPITSRGIIWSSGDQSPDLASNDGKTEDGTGLGSFTSQMTNLTASTTYYVRAYASNSEATAFGEVKTFQTTEGGGNLPGVIPSDLGNIFAHKAVFFGEITDDGGDAGNIIAGIVWSTSTDPDISNKDGMYQVPDTLSKNDVFIAFLTGLEAETKYYIRPFATNSNGTAYGEEMELTTLAFAVQEGTYTDNRDNTEYATVTIFEQTWMAQNLAYLPEVHPANEEGGFWVYDYNGTDVADAKSKANYSDFGVLYDLETSQEVCPTGWHLPSSGEWSELEMNLGMDYTAAHTASYGDTPRGTDEGGKLKETGTTHWNDPNTGATNIARFNAVPGGWLDGFEHVFQELNTNCRFWTSTTKGSGMSKSSIDRNMSHDSAEILLGDRSFVATEKNGYSVRCIKD